MSSSEIKELEKKVKEDLRKAQNNMFSGKNEEAWNMIEEIWTDIEKIRSLDPNYRSISSMERTYNKLKGDLERKLGKGQKTVSTQARPRAPPSPSRTPQQRPVPKPVVKEIDLNKLPAGVTKRLGDIERPLQRVESSLNEYKKLSDLEKAGYELQSAISIYEEIERMYSDYVNHADVQSTYTKINQLREKFNILKEKAEAEKEKEEQKQKQMEEESKRWVEKISPYLIGSGVFEKQLELSRIRGKENLINQAQLLEEAKSILNEYKAHDWSKGKTWDLEQSEAKLTMMINEGEDAYNNSINSVIDEAATLINEKIKWFNNDTEWRTDETKKPFWLYNSDKKTIEERMALVEELVPEVINENNSKYVELKNQLDKLMEMNKDRLDIIPKRTHMLPVKYLGDDSEILKTKAGELVKEIEPSAKILKVHLIREDWRVEDVIEHTDTTKTAIRHRITYHLPSQVAAQIADKTLLYTAHIAKNQRPDGSFDALYGNLEDYLDMIAPENIPK